MGGPEPSDPGPESTGAEPRAPGEGRDLAAEPSYYEIALTSRQVLVGFVILLASVVVAFFAGVWVGKSGSPSARPEIARAEPRDARPGAREGGRQARGAGEESAEGAGAKAEPEEFQFFSEEPDKPKVAAPPAPAPGVTPTGSTLAEDVGAGVPPPSGVTTSVPAAASPTPATTPGAVTPSPTTPPPVAPAATAPSPAPAAGSLIVQVFSSTDEAQARKVLDQLTKAGFKAFVSPTVKDGATMHRVRVGPFRSDADARKVAEAIKKKLKLDPWITR